MQLHKKMAIMSNLQSFDVKIGKWNANNKKSERKKKHLNAKTKRKNGIEVHIVYFARCLFE